MRARLFFGGDWIATLIITSRDDIGYCAKGTILYMSDAFTEWNGMGWVPVSPTDPKVRGLYGSAVEAEQEQVGR